MPAMSPLRSWPDTRTTPMAPAPGAVATATMTSARVTTEASVPRDSLLAPLGCGKHGFALEDAIHVPLLEDLQRDIDQPVENQARREEDEHHRKRHRHDLHHLGLYRILDRRGREAHLQIGRDRIHHRQHEVGIGCGEIVYPADPRRMSKLDGREQHPIE